ncbi:MAG: hypothetical protein K9G48_12725 [Reyranella sp.]|nr:hypothetical protein [Reyranella sp.]
MTAAAQLTIGGLISALRDCDPLAPVELDLPRCAPNGIHPYPGRPGHLAFGPGRLHEAQRPTVQRLVDVLYSAIHQTFRCRTGEAFQARSDAPLWVSEADLPRLSAVVGVDRAEGLVTIRTQEVEA